MIDPTVIHAKHGKTFIVVSEEKPNDKAVKRALQKHFKDWKERWTMFEKLGPVREVAVRKGGEPLYVEVVGASFRWAAGILAMLAVHGKVPEPVRVARLVARGFS